MGWIQQAFGLEQKQSRAYGALSTYGMALNEATEINNIREGYKANPYIYRAVRLMAQAVCNTGIHLVRVTSNGEEQPVERHQLVDLMQRPNPLMGETSFIDALTINLMIQGEVFIEGVGPRETSPPNELYVVGAQEIKVETSKNADGFIQLYRSEASSKTWTPEEMHIIRLYDPEHPVHGFSPITAAALSADANNYQRRYNKGLVKANGVPPHQITVNGVSMSPEDKDQYEERWREKVTSAGDKMQAQGSAQAIFFEGDVNTERIGLSPRDMDHLKMMQQSAREIAVALGPAPELLGDPENKVYNNLKEAKEALYVDHAIPMAQLIADELTNWLLPKFSGTDQMRFALDTEGIEALQPDPNEQRKLDLEELKAGAITRATYKERRGEEPGPNDDVYLVPTSSMMVAEEGMDDAPMEDDPIMNGQEAG